MGKRPLSKKELEEQRKKEQEQAAAQVSNTELKNYNCKESKHINIYLYI